MPRGVPVSPTSLLRGLVAAESDRHRQWQQPATATATVTATATATSTTTTTQAASTTMQKGPYRTVQHSPEMHAAYGVR